MTPEALLAEAIRRWQDPTCIESHDDGCGCVTEARGLLSHPPLAEALARGLEERPAVAPDTLDAAWQAVLEALPPDHRGPTIDCGWDDWSAEAWPPVDPDLGERDPIEGRGSTPIAALRALAAALRQSGRPA